MSKIYTSADQLIGHTPLLELAHIEAQENLPAKILAKLEYFNPASSSTPPTPRLMLPPPAPRSGMTLTARSISLWQASAPAAL